MTQLVSILLTSAKKKHNFEEIFGLGEENHLEEKKNVRERVR